MSFNSQIYTFFVTRPGRTSEIEYVTGNECFFAQCRWPFMRNSSQIPIIRKNHFLCNELIQKDMNLRDIKKDI